MSFPIPETLFSDTRVAYLSDRYLASIVENSNMLIRHQRQTGKTETQSFKIQASKSIIEDIDLVCAEHYGFTDEELDFIVNYDIKFRMGLSTGG